MVYNHRRLLPCSSKLSIWTNYKDTLGSLCHLPTQCRQQTFDNSVSYLLQSIQKLIYVSRTLAAACMVSSNLRIRWNEWITLPIRYCDLPLSSQLTFTVWDTGGPRSAVPVGGSTFRLFGKKWWIFRFPCKLLAHSNLAVRTLRRGKHRLLLWPDVEADGSVETTTPSKMEVQDEMGRLEKVSWFFISVSAFFTSSSQLVKKYERGDLLKSDWLDKLTFRKMEEIHAVRWLTEISASCMTFVDRPRQRNQKTSSFTLIYPVLIFLWFSANQ